jgi:hypothetical protein
MPLFDCHGKKSEYVGGDLRRNLFLGFCHPELVEGSVPFPCPLKRQAELILQQAQDDGLLIPNQ